MRRTLGSNDQIVSKPIFKDKILKSSFEELQQETQTNTSYFTPRIIDWLFAWTTRNNDAEITTASAATIAFLAFPNEQIPHLRDRIFQDASVVKCIIRVACENKLSLAEHIEKDELDVIEKIGSGSGGEIFTCIYKDRTVAVKFFKKQGFWFGEAKEFYYEATIISLFGSFKHFIVSFGVNFARGFIVMPLADNKSLDVVLQSGVSKDWSLQEKLRIITQIAGAVRTLHRYGIMHRDLKPANILLDEDFNCYLADFGISKSPTNRKRSQTMNVGTSMYMAPEVVEGDGMYSEQIDVYSFGIIVWQIITDCVTPYLDQGIHLYDIASFVTSGARLEIPEDCPPKLSKLISRCWHSNPKKRPSFQQILQTLRS